jgi:hypothetical protein
MTAIQTAKREDQLILSEAIECPRDKNLSGGISKLRVAVTSQSLGIAVALSSVARYMAKNDDPSGESRSTFLRTHAQRIATRLP